MKIRQKILIIISIFIMVYATYYWVVPFVVNIQSRIPLIQQYALKEFGAKIELNNPKLKMGLIPSIWVEADSFKILDAKASPLAVENPKLKISLIPLFFGNVHLDFFSCDNINAKLKFDKQYKLYIGNYLLSKKGAPNLSVENSQMATGPYQISIKDELLNKNINIKGESFYLDKFNSKKHIKFSTISNINIDKHHSEINMNVDLKLPLTKGFDTNEILFDGSILNLNLADLSPYITKLTKGKIQETSGILNLQANTKSNNFKSQNLLSTKIISQIVVDNLLIMGEDKTSTIYFKNKLNLKSDCDFSKNKLTIENFKILSGNLNLNASGKINKISSKKPNYDLSVSVDNSRLEDFISLMPAITIPDLGLNLAALKKYGIFGDISGKLTIKGKKPKISGNMFLKNGYVIKQLPPNVPKANVKVKFLGDKFALDVLYPLDINEKVKVVGTIEMFNEKKANLVVTSTPQVNLQTVESILNPLHEIFNFELGPLPIMKVAGIGNVQLNISGPQLKPSTFGVVNFKNAAASFNGLDLEIKNANASLYFNNQDVNFATKEAYINGKNTKITGKVSSSGNLNFDITANGQDLNALLNILKNSPMLKNIQEPIPNLGSISGKANLTLNLNGKSVKKIEDFTLGKNVTASGNIKLLGNSIGISFLNIPIKNIYGNIKFKNTDADFDLYSIVGKAKIYLKGKTRNNILKTKIKLDDLAFSCLEVPAKIYSGILEINNDKLSLYKINAIFDSMPILIDGTINNIFKDPNINIYINSKPSQKFIDKYINRNATYPLKVRGDINYTSRIHGLSDSFNVKTEINMQEDSAISYMGASIGDANNPIRIYLDANINKNQNSNFDSNTIYINNFQYDKLISSQNNKEFISPQMSAKGKMFIEKNNISFNNFRVKTQNPTDAKIFNLLFKKSLIKQGLFNSNIVINNSINTPKIIGFLNFTGIDIPLLDTTIKDISLNFNDKDIYIKSDGEVFSNKIVFTANTVNKLTKPYIIKDLDIYLGKLDINKVMNSLNKLSLESKKYGELKNDSSNSSLTDLIIHEGKIKADNIWVKSVYASDFTSKFSLNDKLVFNLDDFKFNSAQGRINGDFKYNLLNSNSALNLKVNNVNANTAVNALFDLPNQVHGSLTGQIELTCNGRTHKTCTDTLSGNGGFSIKDGKMPKLGSLEYLLKASNLVKSGVTGLTINSIVDLISPLKTGQFENINGMFSIKSGIANEIQIFSKGKDLSLFITGTYNFSTVVADMQVFGRLSKKISNILGPVGNTSLNTLFNTIPGLDLDASNKAEFIKNFNKIPGFELNDKMYRIFSAKIYGDINGENYVQSFKWIE